MLCVRLSYLLIKYFVTELFLRSYRESTKRLVCSCVQCRV